MTLLNAIDSLTKPNHHAVIAKNALPHLNEEVESTFSDHDLDIYTTPMGTVYVETTDSGNIHVCFEEN